MQLITWNTQWCCGIDGRVDGTRILGTARAMADFDVLCLQEIASGFDELQGGPGDQFAQIEALLPGFRVFGGAAVEAFDAQGRHQRFGNLIATRLPVACVQHHPLPWPPDAATSSMPRMCSVLTLVHPVIGAVRVMTTHLAYDSAVQRQAQVEAILDLHLQDCRLAQTPPQAQPPGSPFQSRPHTAQAILCGDFNMTSDDAGYRHLTRPSRPPDPPQAGLRDAWPIANSGQAQAPTFRIHDDRYGKDPIACDFIFVSEPLAPRVREVRVDVDTQASDHQPVLLVLDT